MFLYAIYLILVWETLLLDMVNGSVFWTGLTFLWTKVPNELWWIITIWPEARHFNGHCSSHTALLGVYKHPHVYSQTLFRRQARMGALLHRESPLILRKTHLNCRQFVSCLLKCDFTNNFALLPHISQFHIIEYYFWELWKRTYYFESAFKPSQHRSQGLLWHFVYNVSENNSHHNCHHFLVKHIQEDYSIAQLTKSPPKYQLTEQSKHTVADTGKRAWIFLLKK